MTPDVLAQDLTGVFPVIRVPRRVRVQGDLFHGRIPDGAVYVGRAAPGLRRSPYANPFRVEDPTSPESRAAAVALFGQAVANWPPAAAARARTELAGRDLACWCPLPAPGEPDHCHAALLLALASGSQP